MDDIIENLQMLFHKLSEIDENFIDSNNIIDRDYIRLLSYNIFIRPPPIKNNENDWKDERLIDFIKHLDNYDVVCLQEMFNTFTSRKQALIKCANKLGLFFVADPPAPSYFSKNIIDAGLIILSRFPIIESEFRPFKYTVSNCSIVEKGVLYAKIKLKDSFLIVFNTHLQSTYYGTTQQEWDLCIQTRLKHVQEISQFISEIIQNQEISSSDRVILTGDFNIDAHGMKNKIEKLGDKFPYKIVDEYNLMIQILNNDFISYDLWKMNPNFTSHPFTYGVTGDDNFPNYDRVLTHKEDIGCTETLDYIFEIYTCLEDYQEAKYKKKLQIDYTSIKTEEFLINYKPYQQLSDHFGVVINILYVNNNES